MAPTIAVGPRPAGTNEGTPSQVRLAKINVLPQMRVEFNDDSILELARDIAKPGQGVLQCPGVAKLTKQTGERYLAVFNTVKGTSINIDQLKFVVENGRRYYYVLIFGERRVRSLRYIFKHGNPELESDKAGRNGRYYQDRFGGDIVDVNVFANDDALDALGRQLSENTYELPSQWDEANAYLELFTFRKMRNPKYTLAQFARDTKRSEEAIRARLMWGDLPEDIQKLVRQGDVKYGIAIQLARLLVWCQRNIEDEVERDQFFDLHVLDAVLKDWKVTTFSHYISVAIAKGAKDIELKRSGDYDLVSMFQESARLVERQLDRKKEIGLTAEIGLRSVVSQIRRYQTLLESGRLKARNAPVLAGSVRRQVRLFVDLLQTLVQAGRWLLSPEIYAQLQEDTEKLKTQTDQLDTLYPDNDSLFATTQVVQG